MMNALRTAAAVTRMAHVQALRLSGPGAHELLDAVTTSRLFARENQMLQTLLLDAGGFPFADAFVCLEEDAWILLTEGPSQAALLAHLERVRLARFPSAEVAITDLLATHVLWSVDGPFAWEVTSSLLGPEVLGAPYLSFLTLREVICFRAGKTGEYGYLLLVPSALAAPTWDRLLAIGAGLGLVEADLAALDQCALENWHFCIRALGDRKLIPHELQLQWRVDAKKEFEGSAALRARLAASNVRLTSFVARTAVARGDGVKLDDQTIGSVLQAGFSSTRGDWVGWAVIDSPLAWPGIRRFHVAAAEGVVPIETCSPPVLDNRSLFVDQRKHSYRTRDEQAFPPLVSR
jgi:glycine cleavage system aminomethyltransferase T